MIIIWGDLSSPMRIYICLSKLSTKITSSDFLSSFNQMTNEDKIASFRNHNYAYAADGSRYHGKIKRKKLIAPKDITLGKLFKFRFDIRVDFYVDLF